MKFEISHDNITYDTEWVESTDFEKVKMHSVIGFIFDKSGKLCMIRINKKRGWTLVGGRVEEYDLTPEDALIRETNEEADLDLKNIKRIGYWKTTNKNNPKEITYSARFVAEVKKVKPQTIDPAEGIIPERKFISPTFKEFNRHTYWGKNGEFQLKKALSLLKK
jgi:ADP-ribose pyrophosphatase YjhB (NUDIX family)